MVFGRGKTERKTPASLYSPLLHNQFRLLRLKSGDFKEDLQAELLTYDIASPRTPSYVCLSYTWGTVNSERPIFVNGVACRIRRDIAAFLKVIRHWRTAKILWVDALCIDQRNPEGLEEKAAQVAVIHHIFRNAERVLIWLGLDWHGGSDLLRWTRKQYSSMLKVVKVPADQLGRDRIAALCSLAHRPYWSRTWVIQEVIHARRIDVYCGFEHCDWDVLSLVWRPVIMQWFKDSNAKVDIILGMVQWRKLIEKRIQLCPHKLPVVATSWNRIGYATGTTVNSFPFLNLISSFRDTLCQDPLDKIYALLSLDIPSYSRDFERKQADEGTSAAELARQSTVYPDYSITFQQAAVRLWIMKAFTQVDELLIENKSGTMAAQALGFILLAYPQLLEDKVSFVAALTKELKARKDQRQPLDSKAEEELLTALANDWSIDHMVPDMEDVAQRAGYNYLTGLVYRGER